MDVAEREAQLRGSMDKSMNRLVRTGVHQLADIDENTRVQSEDEDLSLQPQATTAAYASKGGGILDALADLKTKAEESLSSARKTEMEACSECRN